MPGESARGRVVMSSSGSSRTPATQACRRLSEPAPSLSPLPGAWPLTAGVSLGVCPAVSSGRVSGSVSAEGGQRLRSARCLLGQGRSTARRLLPATCPCPAALLQLLRTLHSPRWRQASARAPSAHPAPHALGSRPASLFLDPKNQVTAAGLSWRPISSYFYK